MSTQIYTNASIRNQNQVNVFVPVYVEARDDLKQGISQSIEKEAEEIKDEFLGDQGKTIVILKL